MCGSGPGPCGPGRHCELVGDAPLCFPDVNGTCATGPKPCPSQYLCNKANHTCAVDCSLKDDCNAGQDCYVSPATNAATCYETCRPHDPNWACQPGFTCENKGKFGGICLPTSFGTTAQAVAAQLLPTCNDRNATDCVRGTNCKDGNCVPIWGMCGSGPGPCGPGRHCELVGMMGDALCFPDVNGTCATGPRPCPSQYLCNEENHTCAVDCSLKDDCTVDQDCYANPATNAATCYETCRPYDPNWACQPGFTCENKGKLGGVCLPTSFNTTAA